MTPPHGLPHDGGRSMLQGEIMPGGPYGIVGLIVALIIVFFILRIAGLV